MMRDESLKAVLRPAKLVIAVLAALLVLGFASRAMAVCGDGILDAGEQCDDGNTLPNDCCSPTCQIEPASTICRASTGPCDVQETCNGSAICPPDAFQPAGSVCRPAAGIWDAAEVCNGSSGACPPDVKSTGLCRPAVGALTPPGRRGEARDRGRAA
jgi:cysteine-rich repeat protein